jgi:hypothetical protein
LGTAIECVGCGRMSGAGARFCDGCGRSLVSRCTSPLAEMGAAGHADQLARELAP